ncbi:MAG: hypothetical protein Q9195_005143 [Heterodermia aff. obscurata]
MPVPIFGFSLGDFIAGIGLLLDIFQSLNSTNGAPADYKELWRELMNLKIALQGVRSLSPDPSQGPQASVVSSIASAVNDCLSCIDGFMQKNKEYSQLGSTPANRWSSAGFKSSWRMVGWATWKKAEVAKFKGQVQQHVAAIQMLLAELEIHQSSAQGNLIASSAQQNVELHKSLQQSTTSDHKEIRDDILLQGKSQETCFKDLDQKITQVQADVQHNDGQVELLLALERSIAGGETQYQRDLFHQLLQIAKNSQTLTAHNQTIISSQKNMIQNQQDMLAEIRGLATIVKVSQNIPAQVLLSDPVILLDARGRRAPFHLEFIDSVEALIAVLKVRFRDVGLRRIERGQFALEDTARKRNLDLSKTWNAIVRPGQHISMSMIFRYRMFYGSYCPSCVHENESGEETEIACANTACGLTYYYVHEDGKSSSQPSFILKTTGTIRIWKVESADDVDNPVEDDVTQYARVQIRPQGYVHSVAGESIDMQSVISTLERYVRADMINSRRLHDADNFDTFSRLAHEIMSE